MKSAPHSERAPAHMFDAKVTEMAEMIEKARKLRREAAELDRRAYNMRAEADHCDALQRWLYAEVTGPCAGG